MKVFIVYWHPEPTSFNHAMLTTASAALADAGAEVRVSNLQEMAFDPVSSRANFKTVKDPDFLKLQLEELHATQTESFDDLIESQIALMEWCDLMIWQFPLWWFGLPAALKGWVDRCFACGRVYSHSKSFDNGAFKGKRALLSFTTGGSKDAYEQGGFAGEALQIVKPIHRGMLEFTGWSVLNPHIVNGPIRMTHEERQAQLNIFAGRLKSIEQEEPIEVGGY